MPPLPDAEGTPSPSCNYCADWDPVHIESSDNSGDERTLTDILKEKQASTSSGGEHPIPKQGSPASHPRGLRATVQKQKASTPSDDVRQVLL